ncbi:P-II family nitrogen regulator [Erysipelothrix urinaevulpis]|uniref:P-II family nitrogen regulator n=1 Tax=Erysipelothrix urinaevulpis TaxID=2683717 RepID=UPI00135711D6|nr:P-II family nitrogen regulator [Erysipelothrix urinaevulpis]
MEENHQFILVCSIVEEDYGSSVLKVARETGISGGTIIKGKGSVRSSFLNFLGLSDSRKEICLNILREDKEETFYSQLNNKLKINQENHGLVFSVPIEAVYGLRSHKEITINKGRDIMGFDAIFTITDMGQAEDVIASAKEAGASGGTVMHARGSGIQKNETLFNIEIEPEKDVVFILSSKDKTEAITEKLNQDFEFENPGHGILFVLDVSKTMGLYQK